MSSSMAKESDHVKKARLKLEKQIDQESKLVTPEALKDVQDKIYRWIERHSRERLNLRDKNIALFSLFDTNEHPARTSSKFVHRLREQISSEIRSATTVEQGMAGLKGRIKLAKNTSPDQE